jgi:hypothetical protein
MLRWRPPRRRVAAILARESSRARAGVGATLKDRQGICGRQIGAKGTKGRREVVTKRRAQGIDLALAHPDKALMGPGQHPDRASLLGISGDRSVVMTVGAHEICQQLCVAGIRLGTRCRVAIAVAAGRQGIDAVDPVACRSQ